MLEKVIGFERTKACGIGGRGRKFAAIDLGTNSCRLLVAELLGSKLRVIYAFSRIVRLGDGLDRTGVISSEAMGRAIEALQFCKNKMDRFGVSCHQAVATQACRVAGNRDVFIAEARQETGLDIQVIDAFEEANLSLLGCAALLSPKVPYAVIFDIGGGSTEVLWVDNGQLGCPRIVDYISVPIGVATPALLHGAEGGVTQAFTQALAVLSSRNSIEAFVAQGQVQMIGTSGTVTTLAAMERNLKRYDRRAIDGIVMPMPQLLAAVDQLYTMSDAQRSSHPCIGPVRSDFIIAGAKIFECIQRHFLVDHITIADRGVREGILARWHKSVHSGSDGAL